jgi:hypothetical protein
MGALPPVPEGRSDRSLARSAWESTLRESRPVGYGVIRGGMRNYSTIGVNSFLKKHGSFSTRNTSGIRSAPDHTVPYGTVILRQGYTRHFVPGYDRAVPPGLSPFGQSHDSTLSKKMSKL